VLVAEKLPRNCALRVSWNSISGLLDTENSIPIPAALCAKRQRFRALIKTSAGREEEEEEEEEVGERRPLNLRALMQLRGPPDRNCRIDRR
jgi:hypothetical protein